jgi:hypothetical protein
MRSILYYQDGYLSLLPERHARVKLVYEGRIRSIRGWPVDVQDQLGLCLSMTNGLVRSLSG